ncbi:MAG: hypothetical protein NTV50_06105, partial [Planctomycetota bacterium]|nr:hypothetical protein [Planctomycetota bacterium]
MNCNQIREQILCAENISKLQKEVAQHVQSCPACRVYQSTVQKMEIQIGQLQVAEPLHSSHIRL